MKCKRCKKECMESELKDGYCFECYSKYKNNIAELKSIKNSVAEYFKKWSICCIILGIILVIISIIQEYGFFAIVSIIATVAVVTALLRAVAEIIQLLEDIKNK